MDKRPPTEAEIRLSLERQKLAKVAPGDELGRARAIRTARLQAQALSSVAHLLTRRITK
jgi:hypothetical protein